MAARNVMRIKCLCEWQRCALRGARPLVRYASSSSQSGQPTPPPDMVIPVPPYKAREGEDVATKRARLLYQSRLGDWGREEGGKEWNREIGNDTHFKLI